LPVVTEVKSICCSFAAAIIGVAPSCLSAEAQARDAGNAWEKIAPYFEPPAEFSRPSGPYPSLLRFYDGRQVATSADWLLRRREIRDYWMSVMGPWPPLLEKPAFERQGVVRRGRLSQYRVRIEVAPEYVQYGYLLIPDEMGALPAVLVPYYDAETSVGLNEAKAPFLDFGYQLAIRGFVTLSISSPGGDARNPPLNGAKCQPLSYLAYIAANCCNALANQPEVDPRRIGIVGHSYGGKWAMFASCLYDKFACAAWSDPGIVFDETRGPTNYWEEWYLGLDPEHPRRLAPGEYGYVTPKTPRTGAYKRLVEEGHDLVELHGLMAPRPFLVSGGSVDYQGRWSVLDYTVAVDNLLGFKDRVAMTTRPYHPPTAESEAQICAFFEHFLLAATPRLGSGRRVPSPEK
jgi:dienelactone hydrolase